MISPFYQDIAKPKKRAASPLEETFVFHLKCHQVLEPWIREYRFHPKRRWKFDFCFPDKMVAVECEGGIWSQGRHTTPKGYHADCEKYNAAAILGWRVLRFTAQQIKSGEAIKLTIDILEGRTA